MKIDGEKKNTAMLDYIKNNKLSLLYDTQADCWCLADHAWSVTDAELDQCLAIYNFTVGDTIDNVVDNHLKSKI